MEWKGRIESLSLEGVGVGTRILQSGAKALKHPVFVPWSVPGDIVLARITGRKGKYEFAEIDAVLEESSHRTQIRCPHFMTCSGCALQHVSREEQLRQKARQLSYHLQRKGVKLPYEPEMLSVGQQSNYAWQATLSVVLEAGKCTAGFRERQGDGVVSVRTCFVVHRRILDFIRLLGVSEPAIDAKLDLKVIVGQRAKLGILVPLESVSLEDKQPVKEFFEDLYARNRKIIGNIFFQDNGVRSYGQVQEHFTYESSGLTFNFLPTVRIQPNIPVNGILQEKVIEFLWKNDDERGIVLSCFAGLGNLALPAARRANTVVAVEPEDAAVMAGRTNAIRNGLDNVLYVHKGVESYLREFADRAEKSQFTPEYPRARRAILEPEKSLSAKSIDSLNKLTLEKIVYVSNDPKRLAEDLASLNYIIRDISAVETMPDCTGFLSIVLLVNP